MDLSAQTAIITGAGSGIGRAIALALASAGATVVAAGRSQVGLEETVAMIMNQRGRAVAVRVDVAREDEVHALFRAAEQHAGPVDILVTAAGICPPLKPVTAITTEEWDEIMAINARGTFLCAQEAARSMRERRAGAIITISSMVGRRGVGTVAAYGASKAAVIGFTESLADELREFGVKVQVICPGPVDTPMRWKAIPDFDRAQVIAPEDIAEAVLFMLTRRSNVTLGDLAVRSLV
jgi:NAD(P)-dependent dehydrogenase (short-subunit alcohol dehydrogenase family)